ncbi:hypothetical protein [Candidatus Laterigemmans baculatus]|uniref:hypothetical protein n=1 Tax=Candidatus Laterigemmans baculatus TaxID=2770505 RepID=UPI0013DC2888|nr:hypothetical protein [Candidatus Laterigemmans baculatus]
MHAVQLADLASILALHGPSLLFRRELISEEALHAYWNASRSRSESWKRRLGEYQQRERSGGSVELQAWWEQHYPLLEEILLSEPLTRIYAALAASLDANRDAEQVSPITHSVFLQHLEARNRVLQMMIYGRGSSVETAVRLNRLRAAVESWCDALLGRLGCCPEPNGPLPKSSQSQDAAQAWERYAIDPLRARGFAEEARQLPEGTARDTAGWLLTAAMRETLSRRSQSETASPEANQQVSDAVLMCLRPDLFDSVGVLKSLWLHRLQRGAEQADRVLEELAGSDINAGPTLSGYEMVRDIAFGRWLA